MANEMLLTVEPFKETEFSTLSKLYVDGVYFCFVLEDDEDDEKVMSETRIPGGNYEVTRRFVGKHAENYRRRFNHMSSLWVRNVPNYKYILIHIGNTVLHTAGCLLVGSTFSKRHGSFVIWNSTVTYRKLYTKISNHFKKGGTVRIEVKRNDT